MARVNQPSDVKSFKSVTRSQRANDISYSAHHSIMYAANAVSRVPLSHLCVCVCVGHRQGDVRGQSAPVCPTVHLCVHPRGPACNSALPGCHDNAG